MLNEACGADEEQSSNKNAYGDFPKQEELYNKEIPMKCRHCRFVLLVHPINKVVDSHGVEMKKIVEKPTCQSDVWYIPEDQLPEWMTAYINKGEWTKGKIICPKEKCGSRLGSYNFVSGFKCQCGSQVVAPVHIVKSKVDFYDLPGFVSSGE